MNFIIQYARWSWSIATIVGEQKQGLVSASCSTRKKNGQLTMNGKAATQYKMSIFFVSKKKEKKSYLGWYFRFPPRATAFAHAFRHVPYQPLDQ